eukprot:364983-Chlamydomonas_euryale.AAC.1
MHDPTPHPPANTYQLLLAEARVGAGRVRMVRERRQARDKRDERRVVGGFALLLGALQLTRLPRFARVRRGARLRQLCAQLGLGRGGCSEALRRPGLLRRQLLRALCVQRGAHVMERRAGGSSVKERAEVVQRCLCECACDVVRRCGACKSTGGFSTASFLKTVCVHACVRVRPPTPPAPGAAPHPPLPGRRSAVWMLYRSDARLWGGSGEGGDDAMREMVSVVHIGRRSPHARVAQRSRHRGRRDVQTFKEPGSAERPSVQGTGGGGTFTCSRHRGRRDSAPTLAGAARPTPVLSVADPAAKTTATAHASVQAAGSSCHWHAHGVTWLKLAMSGQHSRGLSDCLATLSLGNQWRLIKFLLRQTFQAGSTWMPSTPRPRATAGTHGSRTTCGRLLRQATGYGPRRRHRAVVVEKCKLGEGRAGAILMFGWVGIKVAAMARATEGRLAVAGDRDCLLLGSRVPDGCHLARLLSAGYYRHRIAKGVLGQAGRH